MASLRPATCRPSGCEEENPNGSEPTNLTQSRAFDHDPAWSPDGTRIAFVSERDGNSEIYAMDSGGSGLTRLTNDPGYDDDPNWQAIIEPPGAFITGGPSGYVRSTSAAFTWSGQDNVTPSGALVYSSRLDSGAWSAYSATTSRTLTGLSQGQHTFYVRAKDAIGNVSAYPSRTWRVDTIAPKVVGSCPQRAPRTFLPPPT